MKEFACGDVVPGCGHVIRADDEDGIFAQVGGHARDEHGLTDIPDDLVAQVRANIRDVA